jgi:hypothetical protein
MGCNTCKSKKKEGKEKQTDRTLFTGNTGGKFTIFLLKLMSFIVVIALLPFIVVLLLYMVFVNLFIPKKDAGNIFTNALEGVINRYTNRKIKKEMKKKEKQFADNRDYKSDSEILDIEVFTNKEDNETEESE